MNGQPTCRYEVTLGSERVDTTVREPSTLAGARRTYRFAAPPTVASSIPDDADVTVADRSLSVAGDVALEVTVRHEPVTTSAPVEGVAGYRLAFEDEAPVTDVSVRADRRVVATETRSRVPYRRDWTGEAVGFRGSGPVELAVAVAADPQPSRTLRRRAQSRYVVSEGGVGTPCHLLSSEAYDERFGAAAPVTRLDGVAYLDETVLVSRTPSAAPAYVHGERCTVRPPGRFEDHFDEPESGRYAVVDRDLARLLGCDEGSQILVRPTDGRSAVFTVVAAVEQPGVTVRLTDAGRERLDVERDVFDAALTGVVADPTLARDEARRHGGVIERLFDPDVGEGAGDETGPDVVVCAPHGGAVEVNTDEQAHRLADRLPVGRATTWSCEGWASDGDAFERFHVRSSDISPRSFPLLSRIADRGFDYAVSFHCHDNDGIVVGGRAPEAERQRVLDAVADAVGDAGVEVELEGEYMGRRPENFVNWLTGDGDSGIQIEQSPDVVKYHWRAVADAVATAFEDADRR